MDFEILPLDEVGSDERGDSYVLPPRALAFLGRFEHVHVTTVRPGHVRGNHYHAGRREVILVLARDRWSAHWDRGGGTSVVHRDLSGGAFVLMVPPNMSHAIRNDGEHDVWLAAVTNERFDADNPDATTRIVAQTSRAPEVLT